MAEVEKQELKPVLKAETSSLENQRDAWLELILAGGWEPIKDTKPQLYANGIAFDYIENRRTVHVAAGVTRRLEDAVLMERHRAKPKD